MPAEPSAIAVARLQIRSWTWQIVDPIVVLDGAEAVIEHCEADTLVPSETVTLAGASVTPSVGPLPHVALAVTFTGATCARVPFDRSAVIAVVVSVSAPVPALHVAVAVSVIVWVRIVAVAPATVAVPPTVAATIS